MLLNPAILLVAAANLEAQPTTPPPALMTPESEAVLYQPVAPVQESEAFDLSYTFLEIGFNRYDPDKLIEKADAYYVRGSIEIAFFYLFGQYQRQDFGGALDIKSSNLDLGGGLHFDLSDGVSLQADIAWLYSDVSSSLGSLDTDHNGYQLRGGGRFLLIPWDGGGFEVEANLVYRDLDNNLNNDGSLGGQLGGRFHIMKLLSLGVMYTNVNSDTELGFNARASF